VTHFCDETRYLVVRELGGGESGVQGLASKSVSRGQYLERGATPITLGDAGCLDSDKNLADAKKMNPKPLAHLTSQVLQIFPFGQREGKRFRV
jgi:hypothetical protein